MSIRSLTGWDLRWAYLISDLTVLALSATYIPISKLVCSLVTVILSGQIIGWMQLIGYRKTSEEKQ